MLDEWLRKRSTFAPERRQSPPCCRGVTTRVQIDPRGLSGLKTGIGWDGRDAPRFELAPQLLTRMASQASEDRAFRHPVLRFGEARAASLPTTSERRFQYDNTPTAQYLLCQPTSVVASLASLERLPQTASSGQTPQRRNADIVALGFAFTE